MAMALIEPDVVSESEQVFQLAAFKTRLGWFGIPHVGSVVCGLKFGFATRSELVKKFTSSLDHAGQSRWVSPSANASFDGFSNQKHSWRQLFVDYAAGKRISFSEIEIDDNRRTEFQSRVLQACRQIPYGSAMAYGELATKAGSPKAARAVGTTMKSNWFPIIIPCHRVIASNGIGGFSASDGTSTKRKLLSMEGYFDSDKPLLK